MTINTNILVLLTHVPPKFLNQIGKWAQKGWKPLPYKIVVKFDSKIIIVNLNPWHVVHSDTFLLFYEIDTMFF